MTREDIFAAITNERARQNRLALDGKIPFTCAWTCVSGGDKVTVLTEELGEVARAVQERDEAHLREELTQLAACCCAWLEAL